MSTNADLYHQDFYAWTQATAALVQAGKWHEIDPAALQEEITDLGHNVYDATASALMQILLHLLKWQYQPRRRERPAHRWADSIIEHRRRITRRVAKSPSLRPQLPQMLIE